jgi:hypothetical protein
MVADDFEEPVFPGETIKEAVHLRPALPDFGKGMALQFLNIPVQYQIPAALKVILFYRSDKEFPIRRKVVPAAASHVEIAYHQDFTAL